MSVLELSRITEPKLCVDYLTAGHCKVTLKSRTSGVHFTYSITVNRDSKDRENPMYFVKVLTQSDSVYRYIGYMFRTGNKLHFSNHDSVDRNSKSVIAINYLVSQVNANKLHKELEVLKSNSCCKCGRDLTTPESIAEGIGPECKKILTKKGKW